MLEGSPNPTRGNSDVEKKGKKKLEKGRKIEKIKQKRT